jgi:hypothetical protein
MRAMASEPTHYDLAIPPGTRRVAGVYLNGVPLDDTDYVVLDDRIRLLRALDEPVPDTRFGKFLLSIGIGVYPKGDLVDLQIERGNQLDLVRARPLGR